MGVRSQGGANTPCSPNNSDFPTPMFSKLVFPIGDRRKRANNQRCATFCFDTGRSGKICIKSLLCFHCFCFLLVGLACVRNVRHPPYASGKMGGCEACISVSAGWLTVDLKWRCSEFLCRFEGCCNKGNASDGFAKTHLHGKPCASVCNNEDQCRPHTSSARMAPLQSKGS